MVKFYLDKKNNNECEIFLDLSTRGKRIRMFTGKRINPLHWDYERRRANPKKYRSNSIAFNDYLQELENGIISILNETHTISKGQVQAILAKLGGKVTSTSFYEFASHYLSTQLEKGTIRLSTFRNHSVTLGYLKKNFPDLDFDGIDLNFYDQFVTWLNNKGLGGNSIGRHIKSLKWFVKAGFDRGLHSNMDYTKKSFKVIRVESDAVYMTPDDISKLATAELPERLRRVADAFVINCHMGLRFADQIYLAKRNFKEIGDNIYLQLVQGKTREFVLIPIPSEIVPLLEKYAYSSPIVNNEKLMSAQKFNAYIKEACELAQIDSIEVIRSSGKTLTGPKFQFVKSHTARRSFATNLYDAGVAPRSIMAVTGHKKEQTFLRYVKSDQFAKAESLAKHYQQRKTAGPFD